MAEHTLFTFQDSIQHLLDANQNTSTTGRFLRMAKRAVLEAYNDLAYATRWQYYIRRHQFQSVGNQTTGTIAYTHSTRIVTLTGATWPTDAYLYRLVIDDIPFDIESYESSTTIKLSPTSNPGSDVASGTTYNLWRQTYPMPIGFRKFASALVDLDQEYNLSNMTQKHGLEHDLVQFDSPNTPYSFTVTNDGEYYDVMSLRLHPPPDAARDYMFLYEAEPRPLRIYLYNTGTASISASSASLTIAGGTLPTNCEGSVIRFGDASNEPDGLFGSVGDTDNTFVEQRVILSRDTTTTATLDSAVTNTYSSVKYTISDPLDLDYSVMLTAFRRLAEYHYAVLQRYDDSKTARMRQEAERHLRLAMEKGRYTEGSGPVSLPYDPFRKASIEIR